MTYAAFYMPKQNIAKQIANAKIVQRTGSLLSQAVNSAKEKISNFDIKSVAKNMTLQSATEFSQKYAVGALTKIINGEPINNKTMADSLFNGFAPALELTAFQSGYNSLMEMKTALCAGNVNIANFLHGFESGLQLVQDEKEKPDYSRYGEEIVIDLLTSIMRNHIAETPDRRVQSGQTYNEYIHNLPLVLSFAGIIKDGKNYSATDFSDRLEEIMLDKVPFTFRAGDKIYENYIFSSFTPQRESENGIRFDAEIKFIQSGDVEFVKVNIPKNSSSAGKRKQVANSKKGRTIKNNTSQPEYIGIFEMKSSVESLAFPATGKLNFL